MPLADDILTQISRAGYVVSVDAPEHTASELVRVRATNPETAQSWSACGPTVADAAADLAAQLEFAVESAPFFPVYPAWREPGSTARSFMGKSPGYIPLAVILVLTAALFVIDLITPGFNVGILYLVPLSLATRCRLRDKNFMLLALLMVLLISLDRLWEIRFYPGVPADASDLFNSGFAVLAVGVCSAIMILARYGQCARRRLVWRTGAVEPARAAAGRGNMRETLLGATAAVLTMAVFAFDLATPDSLNVPTLYLIPLALITLSNSRVVLWRIVLLMLGFSALGYWFSPNNFSSARQAQLIIANRFLVGGGLALVAAILHISARHHPGPTTRFAATKGA